MAKDDWCLHKLIHLEGINASIYSTPPKWVFYRWFDWINGMKNLFFFLRQKANMPAPKHRRQLTTWQGLCQVERRFHNQELNCQLLSWDLGISPPSSNNLGSSRTYGIKNLGSVIQLSAYRGLGFGEVPSSTFWTSWTPSHSISAAMSSKAWSYTWVSQLACVIIRSYAIQ